MNVDPRFIYEVGIEWRRQIIPLESNLTAIAKRVFEVVTEVETGQPLSPFATYPIY